MNFASSLADLKCNKPQDYDLCLIQLLPQIVVINSYPTIMSKGVGLSPFSLEPYTFYNYHFQCWETNIGF